MYGTCYISNSIYANSNALKISFKELFFILKPKQINFKISCIAVISGVLES